jgi:hypothetical protein
MRAGNDYSCFSMLSGEFSLVAMDVLKVTR